MGPEKTRTEFQPKARWALPKGHAGGSSLQNREGRELPIAAPRRPDRRLFTPASQDFPPGLPPRKRAVGSWEPSAGVARVGSARTAPSGGVQLAWNPALALLRDVLLLGVSRFPEGSAFFPRERTFGGLGEAAPRSARSQICRSA